MNHLVHFGEAALTLAVEMSLASSSRPSVIQDDIYFPGPDEIQS